MHLHRKDKTTVAYKLSILSISVMALSLVAYWVLAFFPFASLEINSAEILNPEIRAGDRILISWDFCALRDLDVSFNYQLRNGSNQSIQLGETFIQAGCYTSLSDSVEVPYFKPEGVYELEVVNTIQVNPFQVQKKVIPIGQLTVIP